MNSPIGRVLLELDSKYTEEIILEGGLKLYLDPSYSPEWNVTVTGKIAALPRGYEGPLKEGSKVFFSYLVVNDRKFKPEDEYFVTTIGGNEYFQEYQDRNGRVMRIVAFPKSFGGFLWSGTLFDESGLIDGCQGGQSEVERWKAQFSFGSNDQQVYKNLVEIEGKDYWICDMDWIFAYKNGKNIKAINDYVILKPIEIDVTEAVKIQNGIALPETSIKYRREDCGRVVSVGKESSLKESDIAFFSGRFAEKYDFDGNQYYILKHDRILAKE